MTALPKLEEIYDLIDLKNISRLKTTGGAIEVGRQVCEIVFPMIDKVKTQEEGNGEGSEDQDGDQDTDSKAGGASGEGSDEQDTDSNDTKPDTSSLPQLNDRVKTS